MEKKLSNLLIKVINDEYSILLDKINLGIPPKNMFGDYSFNVGVLSPILKKNPNLIASDLEKILSGLKDEFLDSFEVSGSYLNIKINSKIYTDIFNNIYDNKSNIISNIGLGKNIIVDYIGVNVGKPLHIGHICTPNIGQTLINVYKKLGYNVIGDSHIGDWGIIFGKLITAYKLWGDESKLQDNAVDYLLELYIKINDESSKDVTLEERFRDEFKLLSVGDKGSISLWEKFTKHSIKAMNKNLSRLGVVPDYNIGESFYEGLDLPKIENYPDLTFDMHSIVNELVDKGIATKNDDGSVGVIFSEESGLPSCILQKSNSTHGYLASDLACIKYRSLNWGPCKIIYCVDIRQKLHFQQAFEISKNAGWINGDVPIHAYNGFISGKDGAFSTRKGNIIKLDSLLDEAELRAKKIILEKRDDLSDSELDSISKIVGIGAIKYGHLKKSRETDTIFDWDEFMTFEGNSGPYIQYSYVRSIKILDKFNGDFDIDISGNFDLKEEIDLIKNINNYNNVVLDTAKSNMPHVLCKYCYDLTKSFNTFYNNVHILNEKDFNKKILRLKLCYLFGYIIKDAFSLLSIKMPEKM